jgi:hypothetical protein
VRTVHHYIKKKSKKKTHKSPLGLVQMDDCGRSPARYGYKLKKLSGIDIP